MSINTSELFGHALVNNVVEALNVDRAEELVMETEISISRPDGSNMGDIDLRVTGRAALYDISSILPASSSWRPRPSALVYRSWWEFKRSCQLSKASDGTFCRTHKVDNFIRFYTEYFKVHEVDAVGPIVFVFNGADHVYVEQYIRQKLQPTGGTIHGHEVFVAYVNSDHVTNWKSSKLLDIKTQEVNATTNKLHNMVQRLRGRGFPIEEIADMMGVSVEEVRIILEG